jgi:D-aminopeptidase
MTRKPSCSPIVLNSSRNSLTPVIRDSHHGMNNLKKDYVPDVVCSIN